MNISTQKNGQTCFVCRLNIFEGHLLATKPLGELHSQSSNSSTLYFPSSYGQNADNRHCHLSLWQSRNLMKRVIRNHAFPVFSFALDVAFSLNITLHNIFFSYMSDELCRYQFIDIINNLSTHFKYCGILSEFQNFPHSNIVRIEVKSSPITVARMTISYTIIDAEIVESKTPSTLQIRDLISFGSKTIVQKYGVVEFSFVQTDHYKK